MAGRAIFQPFIGLSGAILTSSSFQLAFPVRRLRDPSPSAKWRTKIGWTIVEGFNDKIDITEGLAGDATATLTSGTYTTGASLATEVQTQLNAAATDNSWTCTYDSTTFKFTIGHNNAQTGAIEWLTGASTATNAGKDLGYDVAADDTGGASYVADDVSYQSRAFVVIENQSAVTGSFAALLGHNLTSSAVVKVQGNSSDAWVSPPVDEPLSAATGDLTLLTKFFTADTLAFWRLLIEDVQNNVGYLECGLFHVSGFIEPAHDFRAQWDEEREELSDVGEADQGGTFVNEKPTRVHYSIEWPIITESEKSNAFDPWLNFVKAGRPFFFAFEPVVDSTFVRYLKLESGGQFNRVPGADGWSLGVGMSTVIE